jgi:hypothetical protein
MDYLSECMLEDSKTGSLGNLDAQMKSEDKIQATGLGISKEIFEKTLFQLNSDKNELLKDVEYSISQLKKGKRRFNFCWLSLDEASKRDVVQTEGELSHLEELMNVYERLNHKDEYFHTLEQYIMKIVDKGDIDKIKFVVGKFDSQYGIHKNLKLDTVEMNENFMGRGKQDIIEDIIKPKITVRKDLFEKVFGKQ